MQTLFLAAGVIAVITSLVHSVLGEILIFRHVRNAGLVPALGAPPLRARNIRILWATWHLASVFGWAFAGLLLRLAFGHPAPSSLIVSAIVFAYLGGAILVLIGTKGRHPGWIALSAVAILTLVAASAAYQFIQAEAASRLGLIQALERTDDSPHLCSLSYLSRHTALLLHC